MCIKMNVTQEDIDIVIDYVNKLKITASIDDNDTRLVQFHWSDPLPSGIDDEAKDLLEISVQYYQRSVFTGEYLMEDDNPPVRKSGNTIDDINFYLKYYTFKLIEELKKAFDLDDNLKIRTVEDQIVMTPYAKAMLEYQKKIRNKKKK